MKEEENEKQEGNVIKDIVPEQEGLDVAVLKHCEMSHVVMRKWNSDQIQADQFLYQKYRYWN